MAKTITQLPDATTVGESDEMIVQQSGVTKRASIAELKAQVATLGARDITVSSANRSITNTGNFALSFGTNNTERVRITAAGNVGVGTTSPSTPLHVSGGDVRVSRTASDGAIQFADADTYIYGNASTNAVTIGTSGANRLLATDGGVEIVGDVTVTDKIIHSGDTNTAVRFPAADTVTVETAGNERLRVHSTGDVSFNSTGASTSTTVGGASWTSTGYHVLYSNATLAASGIIDYRSNWGATNRNVFRVQADGNALNFNNSYGALSDASIKENIEDATPKLDALKQVRVVNFNRIGDPDNKQIGMVAQELETVWPNLVSQDQDGLKSIKYSVLVPILIKAVQELASKVEALEAAQ
jgi:hypothetical protein